jgi:hypothetical protein
MISDTSSMAQWTELGQELSGDSADARRQQILESLDNLETRIQANLRSPDISDTKRLEALANAVETAKEIVRTVLKPVDLSAL